MVADGFLGFSLCEQPLHLPVITVIITDVEHRDAGSGPLGVQFVRLGLSATAAGSKLILPREAARSPVEWALLE